MPTKTNVLNLLRAVVEASAAEIAKLRGHRLTRLRLATEVGTRTLPVESVHMFSDWGLARGPIDDPETIVVSPDTANKSQDEFGESVAVRDGRAIVGAPQGTMAGNGKAQIFDLLGDDWTSVAELTAGDAAVSDEFGYAVAVEGDVAVVTAPKKDGSQGAAYVFTRAVDATWSQLQKLEASDKAASDLFGSSVAISGDTIAIGASGATSGQGALYIFRLNTSTSQYDEEDILTADDGAASDALGTSADISGDIVVSGAPLGGTNGGAAYIWTRSATTWTQITGKLTGDDLTGDDFGRSVALSGADILVGQPAESCAGLSNLGSAFLFRRAGTTWASAYSFASTSNAGADAFGHTVAMDGGYAAVGAPKDDDGGLSASGSVALFQLGDTAETQLSPLLLPSDAAAAQQAAWPERALSMDGRHVLAGCNAVAAGGDFQVYFWELKPIGEVLVEDEPEPIQFAGLDYSQGLQRVTGCDPMVQSHIAHDEVVDWSRNWSQSDALRRATLVEYAEGDDLDRIGRNHGLHRLRGLSDATYRNVIKSIAYTWRGTVYAIELLLDALYPSGGWEIYESLVENPGEIFITIPGEIGSSALGRTYMNAREDVTATSKYAVAVSDTPTTVESVKVLPVEQTLLMGALPSADSPAWTFVPESSGSEGTYFSIVAPYLKHTHPSGLNGGRYARQILELSPDHDWRLEAAWYGETITTTARFPWNLIVKDGEKEYCLMWSDAEIALGQASGTKVSAVVSATFGAAWRQVKLMRDGDNIVGLVDGIPLVTAARSGFAADTGQIASFGYVNRGVSNNWTCRWDEVRLYVKDNRNYWNLAREDGSLSVGSDVLTSAAALFNVFTDIGKLIWLEATNGENHGLWQVDATPGSTQLTLDGYLWKASGYCDGLFPDRYFTYEDKFIALDAPKDLVISDSGEGNNDTYPVLEVVGPRELKLDITGHGADLATESNLSHKFDPGFVTESSIPWTLVDAARFSGTSLILREALPSGAADVRVDYTTVLSAVLKRDETHARNDAYPFYIQGVDERLQALISSITAAGVIPRFSRGY